MGTIDVTEAVDRVRLGISDYSDPEILDDATIQYFLDKNSGNEPATIRECAMMILGALSRQGHIRIEKMEIWGSDNFNSYLKYLEKVILSPTGAYAVGGVYAGGIDVDDILANQNDGTVVQRRLPIGGWNGEYTYLSDPSVDNPWITENGGF